MVDSIPGVQINPAQENALGAGLGGNVHGLIGGVAASADVRWKRVVPIRAGRPQVQGFLD